MNEIALTEGLRPTSVLPRDVFCSNRECSSVVIGKPRFLGQHGPGCRVQCPKCHEWLVVV